MRDSFPNFFHTIFFSAPNDETAAAEFGVKANMRNVNNLPAYVLPSLPAMLGFYPSDSLVIVCFTPGQKPDSYQIGAVARADLKEQWMKGMICSLAEKMTADGFCLAFIVTASTETPAGDLPRKEKTLTVDELHVLSEETISIAVAAGLKIEAIWQVPRIVEGAPYTLLAACTDRFFEAENTPPQGWLFGTIPCVDAQQATQDFVERTGHAPELTREQMLARLNEPNPYYTASELVEFGVRADKTAAHVVAEAHHKNNAAPLLKIFDDIADIVAIISHKTWSAEDLLDEKELLEKASYVCVEDSLRDGVIPLALDKEWVTASTELFLALSRTLSGHGKANALCLAAIGKYAQGDDPLGLALVIVARETEPEHTMAGMLYALVAKGDRDVMLEEVKAGGREVRESFGFLPEE